MSCQQHEISSPPLSPIPQKQQPHSIITNEVTSFDLPIIPLSPFQLEEEYSSQWNLLMKSTSPPPPVINTTTDVHNEAQQSYPITRTTSFPGIIYNEYNEEEDQEDDTTSHQLYKNHHTHHMMKRSVSDLSIPTNPNTVIIQSPPAPQKKKSMARLGLWAKKHIIV